MDEQVNIPALPGRYRSVTFRQTFRVFWLCTCRKAEPVREDWQGKERRSLEKPPRYASRNPYRKPTQVGEHKCAKVYERTLVQELGNTAAVPSV